jgi:putative transposase
MVVQKTHHNAYDAHYHLVFPVKYRKALLTHDIPLAIVSIAREIEERYHITFDRIGTDQDHIHLLCTFPPKYSGSRIVGLFKSITARELFKRFPALKKDLWGGEFWSDGFYLATVSERGDWKAVERYVANQGKTRSTSYQLRLLE